MLKRQFVDMLDEGDSIDDLFVVKSVRQSETKAGKPYLALTIMDKTGEVAGPIWDRVDHYRDICQPGNSIHVSGSLGSFQGSKQLKVTAARPVAEEDVDLASFLPTTTKNREDMAFDLQKLVLSVEDPFIRKLLLKFFKRSKYWSLFQNAPAAKGVHHAYIGGLLEHSLSVAQLADHMAGHYLGVNRSLLLAGALLHDIGKITELSYARGAIDYTNSGRLKGHLVIGSEMVADAALEIKDFPVETREQIQHLILSHHGRREYGSPIVPMTVEAFLLNFLDEIDAKMNVTEQLRRKIDANTMEWTDYQRHLERYLFLQGLDSGVKAVQYDDDDPAARQQSLF